MPGAHALTAEQLHRRTNPGALGFDTTAHLEPPAGPLGQEDAIRALEFGAAMRPPGYNVFVLGEPGSGRRTFVRDALLRLARDEPTPPDLCYVQDFDDPRRPRVLALRAGGAAAFARAVGVLIAELRALLPQALESGDAAQARAARVAPHEAEAIRLIAELRQELAVDPYVVLREGDRDLTLGPARGGEPLRGDAYEQLPAALRGTIDEHVRAARERLVLLQGRLLGIRRAGLAAVAELDHDVTAAAVGGALQPLLRQYAEEPDALRHLHALAEDVVRNAAQFLGTEEALRPPFGGQDDFFGRYRVRVFVQHVPGTGAPVVEELNPTYSALVGHVARQLHFGMMVTDVTGITAGALQRANGGYLLLDAEDLLTRPLAWSALKRALRTRELRPLEPSGEMGLYVADTLEPQAVPAALKVVLIGEPATFYALRAADADFRELFKVKADFRSALARTPEAEQSYARFIGAAGARDGARPFTAAAVARIIEEGSRLSGDQNKLTARFGLIADLVREATHCAARAAHECVTPADVDRALAERHARERRPHRTVLELIERGVLAFEPHGRQVGQLYGLGVLMLGDEAFGRPMRVMASAWPGLGGFSNAEQDVAMSGPIHSKAFILLSGYIARRFARTGPLAVSATLSFDQLYEEVEGDSASAAELYALLSAIAGVPLRQEVAVTGAVNPAGEILPVGGVTEKIEGFFDACMARGCTGGQGVIVPVRNLASLCLRGDVRAAVAEGRFHVWAIARIEDGWPVLAGLEAGVEGADGTYPAGSLYRLVADRLESWRRQLRSWNDAPPDEAVALGDRAPSPLTVELHPRG